jgi:hypothetical protein
MTRARPRPRHPAGTALALGAAILAAGCGSAAPPARGPATQAATPGPPSLNTSLVTAAGTWAVAVMGGSSAQHNDFWQLLMRPAGRTHWKLATPPGVADNGGLVLADTGGQSLITGFRPSQYLAFTPLALTSDGGQAWSSGSPLDAALADVPDALAAAPGTGHLLALLADGTAKLAVPSYTRWTALATQRSLAVTPSGRHCGLRNLTAAAFTPSGGPLLAGTCSHPGTAGIFAARGGTWQAAGPQLPSTLAHQTITVLRLTQAAHRTMALLAAGAGPTASLFAAWSADGGSRWTLSPAFGLNGSTLTATSFGPAGTAAIVLNGNRGAAIAGTETSWRSLPALPPGTATLAPGPGGGFDALAVHHTTLTIWQLAPGSTTWLTTQAITVPIQFGSSG